MTRELGLPPCLRLPPPHHPPAPNPPLSTLPLSITESLINYDIVSKTDDVEKPIQLVVSEYIDAGTKDISEICERVGCGSRIIIWFWYVVLRAPWEGKEEKGGGGGGIDV